MEPDGRIAELPDADAPLRYRVWSSTERPARATVVLLNGIMSHSGWFAPLAPSLVAAGMHVVGADRRGSGPNPSGRGDAVSAAALIDDCKAIIAAEHDPARMLVLVGWCWGAILAVHVAASMPASGPGALDRLVLVTPGMLPSEEVRTRAAAHAKAAVGRPDDEPCVPTPIREELFTEGPALEGFIRRDPDRLLAITPRFAALSGKLSALALARLPRLTVPTLLVLAEHDGATDNLATTAAFERLAPERRHLVTLPTRHGVSFEAPAALAEAITRFAFPESRP
ncbi:MAG: alpha/beta fold hydrolase [Deltaproteobacteria bacterium]|nr:alpha/beta fold hydrolase [Nannocystaceae bacterium]